MTDFERNEFTLAIECVKNTLKNGVRNGDKLQLQLRAELNAFTAKYNLDYLYNNLGMLSQDLQDLISVSLLGLEKYYSDCNVWDCFDNPVKIINKNGSVTKLQCPVDFAYYDINKYIYKQKSCTRQDRFIYLEEFIYDDNGEINEKNLSDIGVVTIDNLVNLTKSTYNLIDNISSVVNLTTSEIKVLKLWVDNYSVQATSEALKISTKTVEKHRHNAKVKISHIYQNPYCTK